MKKNNGFTLVELSIVLVIIAMVIGGVLVGQNLIKSAEINSFVKDMQRFKGAVNSFQEQYNNLPGDIDTAFDYFGTQCAASAGVCNGDGDAIMEWAETFRAWKHLDLAKYINEGLNIPTGTTDDCEIAANLPVTAIDAASAAFVHDYGSSGTNDTTEARTATKDVPGQMLMFGRILSSQTQADQCANSGFITSEQAYIIDLKIDDGYAYDGNVINSENLDGCSTSANTSDDGNYDQEDSGNNLCKLFYRLQVQ